MVQSEVRGEHIQAMDALVAKANPNCCNKDGLNSLMVRFRINACFVQRTKNLITKQ